MRDDGLMMHSGRPSTRSGLKSAQRETRQGVERGYDLNGLKGMREGLKQRLHEQEVEIEGLLKNEERWKGVEESVEAVKKQLTESEFELSALSKTVEKCLNGASVEYVQDEDAQIEKENLKLKQRIEELKKEIDQSQKSMQNAAQIFEKEKRKFVLRGLPSSDVYSEENSQQLLRMQLTAVAEHHVKVLWEKSEIESILRERENALKRDPTRLESYLERQTKERLLFDTELIQASKNSDSKWNRETMEAHKIFKLEHQIALAETQNKQQRHPGHHRDHKREAEQMQEMKAYLDQFNETRNTQQAEIDKQSEEIVSVLDKLVEQQNLKDLIHKLGTAQDAERQKLMDARIAKLQQKQSELTKVDVLEEKIKNEQQVLEQELQTIQTNRENQNQLRQQLSAELQSLDQEAATLRDRAAELQQELFRAEEEVKGDPDLEALYKEHTKLSHQLEALEDVSYLDKAQSAAEAKQHALSLLDALNAILQTSSLQE